MEQTLRDIQMTAQAKPGVGAMVGSLGETHEAIGGAWAEASNIAAYSQKLYQNHFVHARAGNVSVRSGPQILITPSGWSLSELAPEHIVAVSSSGEFFSRAGHKPSSELLIHERIYERCPHVQAIIHAHPVKSTALSVAGISLDKPILAEVLMTLGKVPLVPYYLPGSQRLADAVAEQLQEHQAIILANHGVITVGPNLKEAYYNLELLESYAEIYMGACQLGRVNELSLQDVSDVHRTLTRNYQTH